jgi:hypothetical protein
MDRIGLPNGHHADLRDPDEVTERQRRPITRAMRGVRPEIVERQLEIAKLPDEPDGQPSKQRRLELQQLQFDMTNEEADAYQDATDLATVALVASWSFPQAITLDGVLDLPAKTLDALREAVSDRVSQLFLDTSPDPNPPAPSGGSNGSGTPSAEVPQTTSLTSGAPSVSSSSG